MDVIHERCAGLDVHKLTVVACVVTPGPRGRPHKEVRTFGTTSEALLQLADWLRDRGAGAAALEATGVYWRPVRNVLEAAGVDLLLANPQHIKASPADYPHRQHGLRRRDGGGHRPCPPALRPAPAAG